MSTLESEILKNLHLLAKAQQNKVLEYIKGLLKVKELNNNALLQLVGSIDHSDLKQMQQTIEEGCENIDKNEW